MTLRNREIQTDSSKRLVEFLESNDLHKKDFAEMIGVTLSYVYSLLDNSIPFSTRTTTLERIAVVMDISPEDFAEYKITEEPRLSDPGIEFLKSKQREKGMSNIQVIKKFPRQKRVDIVDLWRGSEPLPLDWNTLSYIAEVLDISKSEIYPYWQARMQQYLISGGIDIISNSVLISGMFEGAKKALNV